MITYRLLEKDFTKSSFHFKEVCRNGDIAIYHKVAIKGPLHPVDVDCGFETIIITRHDGYEIAGVKMEPAEQYPGNEQWGVKGWTYPTLMAAERKFNSLLGKEADKIETQPDGSVKKRRGRAPKSIQELTIPVAEFSIKELAEQNKVQYPVAVQFIKHAIETKSVKYVRDERRNPKGPMSKIYSKNS